MRLVYQHTVMSDDKKGCMFYTHKPSRSRTLRAHEQAAGLKLQNLNHKPKKPGWRQTPPVPTTQYRGGWACRAQLASRLEAELGH